MNLNLDPAVKIWINSIPIGQRGAAVSNAVMNSHKIPDLEARIERMEREIERLKMIAEEKRD
jgi:uncharacterized small protein (DUF1192 family)